MTKNGTDKAGGKRPKTPPYLEESKAFWRKITSGWELDAAGLAVLELLCIQLDRAADARQVIEQEGQFITGRYGSKLNPATTAERRATAAAAQLLRQLDLADDDDEKPKRGRPCEGWQHGVEIR